MARRLWLAVTSVPLAVAVNDQVFGITVIDSNNGGAGMTFLGGDATPNRAIVLSRKQLTFKLLPVKPGDVVVTKCPVDPSRSQALRFLAGENALAYARSGKKYRVRPSRMWLECDVPLRDEDTEDSLLFGGVPSIMVEGKVLAALWPLSLFGSAPANVPPKVPPSSVPSVLPPATHVIDQTSLPLPPPSQEVTPPVPVVNPGPTREQ